MAPQETVIHAPRGGAWRDHSLAMSVRSEDRTDGEDTETDGDAFGDVLAVVVAAMVAVMPIMAPVVGIPIVLVAAVFVVRARVGAVIVLAPAIAGFGGGCSKRAQIGGQQAEGNGG